MRSAIYLQPGERRSCVGCHQHSSTVPANESGLAAMQRPASKIEPGPEGTMPFSYPLLVQGVLDRNCVRCHDGGEGQNKSPLVLSGDAAGALAASKRAKLFAILSFAIPIALIILFIILAALA